MKRIYLFVLLLAMFDCTHYFVRETPEYNLAKEDLEFLQSKKIGLIGFYPFKIEYKEVSLDSIMNTNLEIQKPSHRQIIEFVNEDTKRKVFWSNFKKRYITFQQWHTKYRQGITQTTTTLNQTVEQTQFLKFGIGSKQLVGKGTNNSVSRENLKEFISTYLRRVQELGLEEMEELLMFSGTKEKSIQIKNFDMDYWIVGYHSPGFEENAGEGIKFSVTVLPCILTLGTIPLWQEEAVISTFFVFDKDLNKIAVIQTENLFDSVTAWWIFNGYPKLLFERNAEISKTTPPNIFYKPNLQQFSKELVKILKK